MVVQMSSRPLGFCKDMLPSPSDLQPDSEEIPRSGLF